jgi:hypothetical protein
MKTGPGYEKSHPAVWFNQDGDQANGRKGE